MKEYFLFLDESKPNTNFQNFTLGGIAIEKETYELKLKPLVQKFLNKWTIFLFCSILFSSNQKEH